MKTTVSLMLVTLMLMSCVALAWAEELPEYVQKQSRKGAQEHKAWQKFDKSGQVKFLQVQHTAPASEAGKASTLDGSFGERLVEIQVDPALDCERMTWMVKNQGPSEVWVLVGPAEPVKLDVDGETTFETEVVDNYCYIVVDNEGGQETTLDISAAAGENQAKTTRGKSMRIVWF